MLIKLAWRNIFRNKRRTFIAGTAIGVGLAALIFADALIIGMKENLIQSATLTFLGEAQIHHKDFRVTQEVEKTINHLDNVVAQLEQESIVRHFTLRTITFGMITSPANVQSINFIGIHPATEQYLSQVDNAIIEGTFFQGEDERAMVIGSKLAELLEVGVKDRVVVTVAQAETGDLSQEMFTICGIYHFNVADMDQGMAFARLQKAQRMLGVGDNVHEIAISFIDIDMATNHSLPFWQKFSNDDNEAIAWTEILPQIEAVLALSSFSTLLIGGLLFGIVALVIINTLFMSIHERTFEFGVIRAVGTRPFNVATLIVLEAASLAMLSVILGNVAGLIITYITSVIGIDYTGIELAGVTFQQLLFPVLKINQFISYPISVLLFTIVVSIYPALYVARMNPAEALRKTM